jgi:LPXTG-motif cell wall-anchored protein
VRRLLIAATSALCGLAVMASEPVALAADSSTPTLTLTPAAGPPGTHVTISGKLTAAQIPVWAPMLNTTGIFELLTDLSATCNPASGFRCTPGPANLQGCELTGVTTDETIHLDASTGIVTGSFVVGSTGVCVQSDPDAATHSAPPGEYELAIGCGACQVASFVLTRPAATLPATGFPVVTASLLGSALLVVGILLYRRRLTPLRKLPAPKPSV